MADRFGIPPFVLGCGNFGGIGSAPAFFGKGETKEQAFELMDAAWDMGLDWFDTADAYGGGRSEAWIGEWIASRGHRPRITTKTFNPMDEGLDSGLAPERVRRQLDSSLERLGVERVDLYLAHEPDPAVPIRETFGAFEEAVAAGKVGAYGVSNFGAAELRDALEAGSPVLVQNSFSLLDRGDEEGVIALCKAHGVAYQAFGPLAGGWLTGKYLADAPPPEGSRMTLRPEPYRRFETAEVYNSLRRLREFCEARSLDMAAVSLSWALGHQGVSSIVVGPRSPAHLGPVRTALAPQLNRADWDEVGSLFR